MNKREFLKTLGVGALAGTTGAIVAKSGASTYEAREESIYDRLNKTGKLRCGYINYAPGLYRDPNTGAFQGIFYEVMSKCAKDLGIEVNGRKRQHSRR